ncbi:hypothetical protein FRB99_004198, partial [Tulasnella sp. 403]
STIAPCALLNPLVHNTSWKLPLLHYKLEDIFTHYPDDILIHSETLKQNAEHVYCLLLLVEAYCQGKLPLKSLDFQVELFLLVDPEIEDPRNSHQVVTSSNPDFEFLLILASLSGCRLPSETVAGNLVIKTPSLTIHASKRATPASNTTHSSPTNSTTEPSETKEQSSWEEESSNDCPISLTQAVILVPVDFTKQPVIDHSQLEASKGPLQTTTPQVNLTHDLAEEHSRVAPPSLTTKPDESLIPSEETKDPFIIQTPSTPMTHEEILKALGASIESTYPRLFPEEGEVTPPPEEPSYSPLFPTLNDPPESEGPSYYASLSPRRAPLSNPEKLRRRNLGLCLYCGLSGHQVQECLQLMHHPAR